MTVTINGLTRRFKDIKAVDSVSLEISDGEIFGLLGPNGAGKTTMISMLCTILRPTSGTASINGHDVTREQANVRKSIGVVFQDPSLDEELTARENLDFHGRLYGMSKKLREERITELIGLVELDDRLNTLVKQFSGGMKRRLEIARGMLHHPRVLFLDEPTLGLDPQTRRRIWNYLERLNRNEDITMLLTTHYMEEADALCNRIAIMDQGKIIALDTPEVLKNNLGGDVISLEVGEGAGEIASSFESQSWVKNVIHQNGKVSLTVEGGERKIPQVLKLAEEGGVEVASVSLRKPTLEDVFLHFTGRSIREERASTKDRFKSRIMAGRH